MDRRVRHKTLCKISSVALAIILAGAIGWGGDAALAQPALQPEPLSPQARAQIERMLQTDGVARVIVALRLPYASAAASARKLQVSQVQNRVIQALSATGFQLVHRYQTAPGLVAEVTSQGLDILRRHPDVWAVAPDMRLHVTLSESAALIRADRVWGELGLTGAGVNVAVLDSGVDLAHPDLADHIVAQHCFSKGDCPPGRIDEGESAQDEHGHGTHVAGIITSRGAVSPRGIAPDAGIVAVRIMDATGSGWNSDLVAGLDWIIANQARLNVKVVNLSLGAGQYSDGCDAQDANTMLLGEAIGAVRRAGIVVAAASGNEGLTGAMTAPACISGVMSVGGVYDANLGPASWQSCNDATTTTDQVVCFSDSGIGLDLLAPGAVILSTALGGGQVTKSGTSMAAPHVAATAALMLQAYPNLTLTEIETVLKNTGAPIRDQRNGIVAPRVDALAAVTRVISDHIATSVSIVPASLRVNAGSTATTALQVNSVRDLYTVTLRLGFDPNIVQVVDADPETPGVQIAAGALLSGRDHVVTSNQADNAAGAVEFSAALRGAGPPISGSGPVAGIVWQGQGAGQSAVTVQYSRLASSSAGLILHNVKNSAIQVQPGAVSGTVLLQGRTNHSGTAVYLSPKACPAVPLSSQVIPSDSPPATTDAQGRFEIAAPGGGAACVQAVRSGYLVGQKSAPQGSLGTITLPGGDVIVDGVINIYDLARVASRYGGSDSVADINGDGSVNIFDLALVAGNLDRSGPVSNWR